MTTESMASDASDSSDRKRRMDDDDGPASKRSSEDEVQLKLLLPNSACGAVIGKGGEMIAKLQEQNGIKMLVSKVHDTYPGTAERICRVAGPIPGIIQVLRFVLSDGYAKMESNPEIDLYTNGHYDRDKQIKMIIPHASAGVVIGKAGDGIKEIHEESGAFLDVSKRDKEPQLPERIVTFAGETDQLITCAELLLQRLAVLDKEPQLPERIVTFAGETDQLITCAELLLQRLAVLDKEPQLPERIVTFAGETDQLITCAELLLQRLAVLDKEPQLPERIVTFAGETDQLITCAELLLQRLAVLDKEPQLPERIVTFAGETDQLITCAELLLQRLAVLDKEPQLPERIVTFAGETDQLITCAELLLQRLAADKHANQFPNVSYAEHRSHSLEEARRGGRGLETRGAPSMTGRATRFDFGRDQGITTDLFGSHAFDRDLMARSAAENRAAIQSSMDVVAAYTASLAAGGSGATQGGYAQRSVASYAPAPGGSCSEVPISHLKSASSDSVVGFLGKLQPTLRSHGYSDAAVSDIVQSMQTLAKYNVLGLGLGFGLAAIGTAAGAAQSRQEPSLGTGRAAERDILDFLRDEARESTYAQPAATTYTSTTPLADTQWSIYSSRAIGASRDPYDVNGSTKRDYAGYATNEYAHTDYDKDFGRSEDSADTIVGTVEVPENLIGVVLGRGGATLSELQRYSGTKMSVSRKGDFAPGTDNRIVKISGLPSAVAEGQRLVERRVQQEKFQRAANAERGDRG